MRDYEGLQRDYAELAAQVAKLCRVGELFADKIQTESWKEGLETEIETTRRLLVKAPAQQDYRGELLEEDLEVEHFKAEGQAPNQEMLGVKITHRPTGISGKSYSKESRLKNTEVVMDYLRDKVRERYRIQHTHE